MPSSGITFMLCWRFEWFDWMIREFIIVHFHLVSHSSHQAPCFETCWTEERTCTEMFHCWYRYNILHLKNILVMLMIKGKWIVKNRQQGTGNSQLTNKSEIWIKKIIRTKLDKSFPGCQRLLMLVCSTASRGQVCTNFNVSHLRALFRFCGLLLRTVFLIVSVEVSSAFQNDLSWTVHNVNFNPQNIGAESNCVFMEMNLWLELIHKQQWQWVQSWWFLLFSAVLGDWLQPQLQTLLSLILSVTHTHFITLVLCVSSKFQLRFICNLTRQRIY